MKTWLKDIMSERGVAAVEFAIVSPVLILLLFTIIEFGIVLYDKAVVTNASREGARFGSVHDYFDTIDHTGIRDVVDVYLDHGKHLINLGGSNTFDKNNDIDVHFNTPNSGDLTVTVKYTYDFLVLPDIASINLSATTVMREEDA